MTDRPRAGAKAVTWDWDYLQQFGDSSYCFELTERETAFLMTVFTQALWSTRWFNRPVDFNDIEQFVVDLQSKLMQTTACNPADNGNGETLTEVIREYVGGIIEIEGEHENMGRLTIEVLEGVAYLVDDCGCGTLKRYKLTPVDVDPTTGAIGTGIDSVPDDTLEVDPGVALDCYYDNAANAIIQAMGEFIDSAAGWYVTRVFDVTSLTIGIETAQIVSALLSGSVQINPTALGLTTSEIKNALITQGYQQWLAGKLKERGLNGRLNRWNVLRLTQGLPSQFSFPTPVEAYTSPWGYYANLQSLNNQLSYTATDCSNGTNGATGQCWEIDLRTITSLEAAGIMINESGGDSTGEFEQGVGIKFVDVGQWNIDFVFQGLPGVVISEIGWTLANTPKANATARCRLCYGTGCSGNVVNLAGISPVWIASTGTIETGNPGYGVFINAENAGQIMTHFRIKFSTSVSPVPALNPIACP